MNRKLKGKIVEKFGNQFGFAKVVNEHESNVSRVIHGRREISQKDKEIWAEVLGTELADLFDFEGEKSQ